MTATVMSSPWQEFTAVLGGSNSCPATRSNPAMSRPPPRNVLFSIASVPRLVSGFVRSSVPGTLSLLTVGSSTG